MKYTLLTLFLLSAAAALGQDNWKLSTEQDGIKVYTGEFPGSKVKAIKVQCELNATLSQVVAVIMDVNSSAQWVYHTKNVRLLKRESDTELYYYCEVGIPWPFKDRDFIAHLTVHQNAETKVVTIDGPVAPGLVPVKNDIVRITDSDGKWVLVPNHNVVNLTYTLHADPGGTIPAWLVNLFATEGPLQSIKKLKLQLKKPQYSNPSFSSISN